MVPGRVATSCSQFVYIFINRVRKTSVSCGTKFCVFCVLSFHCVRVSFHLRFHRSWVIILVSSGGRRRVGYVRCRRCRRRRLTAWNTWPRCTARPSAIQPLMAVPTDAARSTRRASEPSCPGSLRGPSAPR